MRNAILDAIMAAVASGSNPYGYGGNYYQPFIDDGMYDPNLPYPEPTGRLPEDVPPIPPVDNTPDRSVPTDRTPIGGDRNVPGLPGDRGLPTDRPPIGDRSSGRPVERTPVTGRGSMLPNRPGGRPVGPQRDPVSPVGPGFIEPLPGWRIPIVTYGMPGQAGYVPSNAAIGMGANQLLSRSGVPSYRQQLLNSFGILPRN